MYFKSSEPKMLTKFITTLRYKKKYNFILLQLFGCILTKRLFYLLGRFKKSTFNVSLKCFWLKQFKIDRKFKIDLHSGELDSVLIYTPRSWDLRYTLNWRLFYLTEYSGVLSILAEIWNLGGLFRFYIWRNTLGGRLLYLSRIPGNYQTSWKPSVIV